MAKQLLTANGLSPQVLVIGPAGSGKIALVDHLRSQASGGPRGGLDYLVLREAGWPGYLEKVVAGGSNADLAILVVNAGAGQGANVRKYGQLLRLMGLREALLVLNHEDLTDLSEEDCRGQGEAVAATLAELGITLSPAIPAAAVTGKNVAGSGQDPAWYQGPTVLRALDAAAEALLSADQPLRLAVESVAQREGRRLNKGRVSSGRVQEGDSVLLSPVNKTAQIVGLEDETASPAAAAGAGQAVGFSLEPAVFLEPGEIVSHPERAPLLTTVFRMTLLWRGAHPLEAGQRHTLRLGAQEASVMVQSIEGQIDAETMAASPVEAVAANSLAEVILRSREILVLDEAGALARSGRCVLISGGAEVASGLISMEGYPDQRESLTVKSTNITSVAHRVSEESRAQRNGHKGGVLWFTGLSGAGKSTLAMEVEQRLFRKGYHTYVLDGDNVRHGLNANLGFSPEDRAENIRRVGEVAALFADAGMICISAFISPYRADRKRAREAAKGNFYEIFVNADLATCEERDPKGLYSKARAGEIADFTGISAPYEPPLEAELIVDTARQTVEESVETVLRYIAENFTLELD